VPPAAACPAAWAECTDSHTIRDHQGPGESRGFLLSPAMLLARDEAPSERAMADNSPAGSLVRIGFLSPQKLEGRINEITKSL
jgi:hypothetical protein